MTTHFSKTAQRLRSPDTGSVLIIVLWLSLGLAGLALAFGHGMMMEYRAAANAVAAVEAAHVIKGAELYITHMLRDLEEPGEMPSTEDFEAEGVEMGNGLFWLLGRGDGTELNEEPVFGLVDEASKLNLNTATREMIEELPGMTPELAAAIIDWRDDDDEPEPDGAESETYLRQAPAYACKNAPFETVEELMLVHGADAQVLVGQDTNLNGAIDAWETSDGRDPEMDWAGLGGGGEPSASQEARSIRGDSPETFGLLEYVTVYSREPNKRADGSARINVNSSEANQQLGELLSGALGQERGQAVLRAIGSSAQGPQQGQPGGGGQPAGPGPEQGGTTYTSLLQLFITLRDSVSLTAQEFASFESDITCAQQQQGEETETPEYLPGLVNVNTAGPTVLACIPGIGTEYAEKLVLHRADMEEGLESIAWVADVLDNESALQAGPYLTTRAYQFSADIAAVRKDGRGFRRTLFVFDTSGDEPIVVYRRDRSRLGWALGDAVRQDVYALTGDGSAMLPER